MEKSEERNAQCGSATGSRGAAGTGPALARTVAAIAVAISELANPASAATLREAAADLMKGAEDGDA